MVHLSPELRAAVAKLREAAAGGWKARWLRPLVSSCPPDRLEAGAACAAAGGVAAIAVSAGRLSARVASGGRVFNVIVACAVPDVSVRRAEQPTTAAEMVPPRLAAACPCADWSP